ncbi:hypothetical protein QTP88_006393 [Uroleucon formosanum]
MEIKTDAPAGRLPAAHPRKLCGLIVPANGSQNSRVGCDDCVSESVVLYGPIQNTPNPPPTRKGENPLSNFVVN